MPQLPGRRIWRRPQHLVVRGLHAARSLNTAVCVRGRTASRQRWAPMSGRDRRRVYGVESLIAASVEPDDELTVLCRLGELLWVDGARLHLPHRELRAILKEALWCGGALVRVFKRRRDETRAAQAAATTILGTCSAAAQPTMPTAAHTLPFSAEFSGFAMLPSNLKPARSACTRPRERPVYRSCAYVCTSGSSYRAAPPFAQRMMQAY